MKNIKDNTNFQPQEINNIASQQYKYGFSTNIENERLPMGLNELIINQLSEKKNEPKFMNKARLKALQIWKKLEEPTWAELFYPKINYQEIVYYSAPKYKKKLDSIDEVDPELLKTFDKLGISLNEQKRLANVAVDAVFDSVSIATTFKNELSKYGVLFCSISNAINCYPILIKSYLFKVVPMADNYFSALNSAVFSDGSFCYIPKNIKCPMELSTYFRINDQESGQFERTLLVAEKNSYVSYLEGCTAPQRDKNQLHAAVVELIAMENSEIKYSTVQNWYAGNEVGDGGIYNFVTKRGLCFGNSSKISWTQLETGSAITWKYPSCLLIGDNAIGEFYSVALTNNYQQADTGTKMKHFGKNTRSIIISKGISADTSKNSYRGLVQVQAGAQNARNFSQCDSLLIGDNSNANTFPYINIGNSTSIVEHEASISKIGADQLFYFSQRGIETDKAISMLVNGFCHDVFLKLPMEFSIEADRLLSLKLENSVG